MTDRHTLLKELNEVSFTADDLGLYLDTHPLDGDALDAFKQANSRRRELLERFARQYEPLTRDCVCPDTNNETQYDTRYPVQRHFTWADGPLPWDKQGGAF